LTGSSRISPSNFRPNFIFSEAYKLDEDLRNENVLFWRKQLKTYRKKNSFLTATGLENGKRMFLS
jgi:hypothetical protein